MRTILLLLVGAALIAGCNDSSTGPRHIAPAAPRGVHSITGDNVVYLTWLPNSESDVTGYRIWIGDCAGGGDCPYDRVGSATGTHFTVTGLTNGVTKYFAVSAVNSSGQESALSYDVVYDTPRPEGTGLAIQNVDADSLHAGYDFSNFAVVPAGSALVDVFYGTSGGKALMIAPFTDTDIQDAGYASSLDAVDFAPPAGWSPSGTVELVTGHCYVVLTRENHYAKFRVTSLTAGRVVVDWAYQVDAGNPELKSRPDPHEGPRTRRAGALALLH
jgi:hypothetical protein